MSIIEDIVNSSGSSRFIPIFPNIRVPPLLEIPETPLRERRKFNEFIAIIPRANLPGAENSVPKPARGQLEPRAGALPRRRRASSATSTKSISTHIPCESKNFDFANPSTSEDSSDDEED